jgi:hypothetical protein
LNGNPAANHYCEETLSRSLGGRSLIGSALVGLVCVSTRGGSLQQHCHLQTLCGKKLSPRATARTCVIGRHAGGGDAEAGKTSLRASSVAVIRPTSPPESCGRRPASIRHSAG